MLKQICGLVFVGWAFHSLVALGCPVPYPCIVAMGSLVEGCGQSQSSVVGMVSPVGCLFCRFEESQSNGNGLERKAA